MPDFLLLEKMLSTEMELLETVSNDIHKAFRKLKEDS
jgi:hypothetical protein